MLVYEQTYRDFGVVFPVRMTPEEQEGLAGSSIKDRDKAMEGSIADPRLACELYEHGYTGRENTQAAMYAIRPNLPTGVLRNIAQIAQKYGLNEGVTYGQNNRWHVLVATARSAASNRDGFLKAVSVLDGVLGAWAMKVEVVAPTA